MNIIYIDKTRHDVCIILLMTVIKLSIPVSIILASNHVDWWSSYKHGGISSCPESPLYKEVTAYTVQIV
jgi:hypothetical protein